MVKEGGISGLPGTGVQRRCSPPTKEEPRRKGARGGCAMITRIGSRRSRSRSRTNRSRSTCKPKKAQLSLVALVTPALSLRQLRYARLELPHRHDRRVVQFLFDPGERRWRTLILFFILILGLGYSLEHVLSFANLSVGRRWRWGRWQRRWLISPGVVNAL